MVGDLADTSEMLEAVVRIAPSLVRVDRCAVLSYDSGVHEFRTLVSFGPRVPEAAFDGLRIDEADMPRLAHRLVSLHLPALLKPDSKDVPLPAAVARRLGLRSALMVPLVCRGRVLGVLWLDHTSQAHYFTSKEINVVQGIATSLAVALDGAQRTEALEFERRQFEALARSLTDGVIVLDKDLRILRLDRGAEELLGWQSSEVRGRRVHEVFDITEAEAAIGWRLEASVPSVAPKALSLRTRGGGQVACELRAVPIRSADGAIVQVLYILRRREAEGHMVPAADSQMR